MAYVIKQYNSSEATNSMTIITDGTASRIPDNVEGGTGFLEECFIYNGGFEANKTYYFHGQIKRLVDKQVFNVFLMDGFSFNETQFIKNITVKGAADGWYDIEFLFTPMKSFNTVGFILNRSVQDYYSGETRYPIIIYQELCEVNNLLPIMTNGNPILQIGVRSIPGLITMINGEEIRLGQSGVYELEDEVLKVSSFSVAGVGILSEDIEEIKRSIDIAAEIEDLRENDLSCCLFDKVVDRKLPNFSIDYIYKEE